MATPQTDTEVQRFDALGELLPGFRRPDGTLLFEGRPARVGILEYQDAQGSVTRELVTAEVLFSEEAMSSLGRAPLTLHHPPGGKVTPDNIGKFQVGDTGDEVSADGGFVRIKGAIRRRDALDAIDQGMRELSVGYLATVRKQAGVWQGQPFDAIQTSRVANHIAIVPQGRAGSTVALRADSTDAIMIGACSPSREDSDMPDKTASVEIKGVTYEGLQPTVAQAVAGLSTEIVAMKADAENAKGPFEAMKGKIAQLEDMLGKRDGEIAVLKKAAKDKKDAEMSPEEQAEADKNKDKADSAAFLSRVGGILPLRVLAAEHKIDKADAMLEPELRRSILAAVSPDLKLDGKSDEYVTAAVDVYLTQQSRSDDAQHRAAQVAAGLRSDGTRPKVEKKTPGELHQDDLDTYAANLSK